MLCICGWGQDTRKKSVGFELGFDGIYGKPKDQNIRAEASYYGEAEKNLEGLSYKRHVGIKGTIRSRDNRLGLSTGVRYSHLNSSLGKADYYSSNSGFFYFLVRQTNNSIEYLKIKEINQSSHYLGVPIEFTCNVLDRDIVTYYVKCGFEVAFLVSTQTHVSFVNRGMNSLQDAVTNRFEEPRNVTSTMGASAGVKIGRSEKIIFTIEAGPWGYLNNRTSGIMDLKGGVGLQMNLHYVL